MSELTRHWGSISGTSGHCRPRGARRPSGYSRRPCSGGSSTLPFTPRSADSRCSTRTASPGPPRGTPSSGLSTVSCRTTGSSGWTSDSATSAAPSCPTDRPSLRPTTRSSTIGRPPGKRAPAPLLGRTGRGAPLHSRRHPAWAADVAGSRSRKRAAWSSAIEQLTGELAGRIRCFVVGSGVDADLADPAGVWSDLSETDPTGAVLVRPDGHVAWRARTIPERVTEQLEGSSQRCFGCRDRDRLQI